MKKIIVSALAFLLVSPLWADAGVQMKTARSLFSAQEKVSVKVEDLPEPVKNAIRSDAFEGWKITDAYLVTREDRSQYYELDVKKGDESARVKLDKNGQHVD
ncbi:hypothetical protein DYBT9275_05733 [Dyadobacter sp. CECT 9275]|uniref:PepSY domain-containing protein n=1 Tax=Dyadobacter helix TaxID=2822344 RepID=A0A916N7K0_9BACT|nr:hypothetical protein [Dyadobacter sp. CECT 9275]CAG5017251.1 hypothetical protein DYBT9275_05733 [Dyadobacter sp. CECT 9275]